MSLTCVFEIDQMILMHLDLGSLNCVMRTCSQMHALVQNDYFWKSKAAHDGLSDNTREYYQRLRQADRYKAIEEANLDAIVVNKHRMNYVAADLAAQYGYLKILKRLAPDILPSQIGANSAAVLGRIDILEWMLTLDPTLYPNVRGANIAAAKGHLDVLKWMESRLKILPDSFGAGMASYEIKEWLKRRGIISFI